MIPIYLEMKAFGPYAGTEIVDFRRLKDHKLFLIYGPTGSGKTTILDAICYALYGSTSGDIRTGSYMRSNMPRRDEPTSVSFRFAIGRKYYRIDRSPEQQIAKKRGDGLKKASAQAALYETDADGADEKLLAAKNVNAAVEGLLGFKADQFRQVVLLPQGDFRKLLLANSGERQQIMQTLFHTQQYAKLQPWLKNAMTNWKAAMNRWPAIGNNVCSISASTMKGNFRNESRNFGIRKLPCPKSGTKPRLSAVLGRKTFRQPRPWKPTGNSGSRNGRKQEISMAKPRFFRISEIGLTS